MNCGLVLSVSNAQTKVQRLLGVTLSNHDCDHICSIIIIIFSLTVSSSHPKSDPQLWLISEGSDSAFSDVRIRK